MVGRNTRTRERQDCSEGDFAAKLDKEKPCREKKKKRRETKDRGREGNKTGVQEQCGMKEGQDCIE